MSQQVDGGVFCSGCGAEITWAPIIVAQRRYCCSDCADGRPCNCGMQIECEEERRCAQMPFAEAYS